MVVATTVLAELDPGSLVFLERPAGSPWSMGYLPSNHGWHNIIYIEARSLCQTPQISSNLIALTLAAPPSALALLPFAPPLFTARHSCAFLAAPSTSTHHRSPALSSHHHLPAQLPFWFQTHAHTDRSPERLTDSPIRRLAIIRGPCCTQAVSISTTQILDALT
jgi:hypothetical protein